MAASTTTTPIAPPPSHSERTRLLRYGSNTTLMVLFMLAALVAVNMLAGKVKIRWDLTANQSFSLSEPTLKLLQRLPDQIKVTGFYTQQAAEDQERARDLLTEYAAHSDKIKAEWVDPQQQPSRALELGVRQDATMVLQMGAKRQEVSTPTESQISGALLKLISNKDATVYFVGGHGERTMDDTSENGYSQLKATLERDTFKTQPLSLASVSGDDWKKGVLVLNTGLTRSAASPAPLLPKEKEQLLAFLKGGGKALLLLGPTTDDSYNDLLAVAGLKLQKGVMLDPTGALFGDARTLVVSKPESSTMTEGLAQTVYPVAAGIVDAGTRPTGVTVQPLMQSSPQSWLETNLGGAQPKFDDGADVKGPVQLAVSVQGVEGSADARLVIIASPDLAANGVLQSLPGIGNMDFLVNAVNWLALAEDSLGIRPKDDVTPSVVLTPAQGNLILLSSMGLFPALIVMLGLLTWWGRR
ncbi:MAG: Gldg family protein [Chloroflexi bacterium]|nr:Gldg family protein [Chloroflexota bacterium]